MIYLNYATAARTPTDTAANSSPRRCIDCRCSFNTKRAMRTVAAGYRAVITATTVSNPSRVASMNATVASTSSNVEADANSSTSRGGRAMTLDVSAATSSSVDVTIRTMTIGHRPLSEGARSNATKNTEMKTPAAIESRRTWSDTGCGASSCTWLT